MSISDPIANLLTNIRNAVQARKETVDIPASILNGRILEIFKADGYIEDFKLRFQDILLPTSLVDCTLLNDSVGIHQTKTLSVCFDIRQLWSNQPLNLNGPLLYYLVMMDNKFSTSCPNCVTVFLNESYQNTIIESELSPHKQLSLGISIEHISCKYGLELIFKNLENPACVTPKTAEILKDRGWIQS